MPSVGDCKRYALLDYTIRVSQGAPLLECLCHICVTCTCKNTVGCGICHIQPSVSQYAHCRCTYSSYLKMICAMGPKRKPLCTNTQDIGVYSAASTHYVATGHTTIIRESMSVHIYSVHVLFRRL